MVYLDRTANTAAAVRSAQALLSKDFVVVPWYEAADFYNKTVRLSRARFL